MKLFCMLQMNLCCMHNKPLCGMAGLEELMTLEEKAKLYAAIGYSETTVDPTLPKSVSKIQLYYLIIQPFGMCSFILDSNMKWHRRIIFKVS